MGMAADGGVMGCCDSGCIMRQAVLAALGWCWR